jgi:hypothetical protein
MRWSDEETWINTLGHIPMEGDVVEIMEGWDVLYDVGISPVFKSLEVNGKLSIDEDAYESKL